MKAVLKDLCVKMGFVTYNHPWTIDYHARIALKGKAIMDERKKHFKQVSKRMDEIKWGNDA